MAGQGGERLRRGRARRHATSRSGASARLRGQRRPPCRGEEGFTLIELLIVLVLIPLVVGAVTMVLITTLKNDQRVDGTVADSSAATLSSEYYTRDVASAGAVTTTTSASPAPCSAANLSGGTTRLLLGLQLQGTTPASEVSYYEWTPGSGSPELVREFCTNGSSTPQSDEFLSDNLSTSNPPVAVVPCASPPPTSIPTNVTCAPGSNWTPTYMLSTVTLNVTQGCSVVGSCAADQYALNGDPQSGVPIPNIAQPCAVLTLLGTGTDINFSGFSANQTLTAQGPIDLNSGYNSTGNPAITGGLLSGNNSVNATSTTSCSNVPASDAVGIYDCDNTSSSGTSTNFAPCPSSGSHDEVTGAVSVSPNPVQISLGGTQTGIADPLLSWVNSGPMNVVSGTGSCRGTTTVTCTPGVYASGQSFSSGATVTFQPGNYQFSGNVTCTGFFTSSQTSLCIQSNDTVNFGHGQYTFLNGIDVVGSGDALCGGGSVTSACTSPPPGGVLFYVKGGNTNLGNNNYATNIQLASSSQYDNVLLWQDGGDNNQLVLSSGVSIDNSLAGQIYAPTAQILVDGWGANVATEDVVANSLSFGSNINLTFTISPTP